ncbi:MAG: DUF3189 family protein [Clostridia bacterium]|nr:DUF3189 family protein [Clostridia bacterium]
MKIIYNCYGGAHSSVTAAAIHLQMLPETRKPSAAELLNLPYYDAQVGKDHGRIRFFGFDSRGNQIYITGKKNLGVFYEEIMYNLLFLGGDKQEQENFVFINTMPYVNIWMVIGGFLSRRLGWKALGRPLVIYGTKQAYWKFIHLINLVKDKYIKP